MNEKNPKDKTGFGLASLILGAAAVLLFPTCVNFILIILAVIFGIIQLATRRKKAMAVVGIVLAGVSLVLSIVFWVVIASNVDLGAYLDSDNVFDYDYGYDYDYDDDYNYDYDYDYDFDYDFDFPEELFPGDEYSVPESGVEEL
jgi:hypothetical protein